MNGIIEWHGKADSSSWVIMGEVSVDYYWHGYTERSI